MQLQGLCFQSPRHNRDTGAIIGQSARTVFDISVWVPGRLVFVAKPYVTASGYSVSDADVRIVNAGEGPLDLKSIELPSDERLQVLRDQTGTDLSY